MNDQTMMLILVMAFFMLGCRFSCSGMKEGFAGGICDMCQGACCSPDCTKCSGLPASCASACSKGVGSGFR